MLSQHNSIDISHYLEQENPPPPFPPASDRDAWEQAKSELGAEKVAALIAQGEVAAKEEIPNLPATLYLEFNRIGERTGFETPHFKRREILSALTIAECLEYGGRFLDPIMNIIWAICEESSWSLPAHQDGLADMEHPHIDLFASMTGRQLAEFNILFTTELDPRVSQRIHYEVNRRLFVPYLTPNRWWWMYNTQDRNTNNWNAVCNGNIVSAAILLEDDNLRLADLIARALRSFDDYLETFDSDGGSTEGPGYWSYGYGNFVLAAHLIEHRTNGRLNIFDTQQICDISQFPARTLLSHNLFVNFSDCDMHVTLRAPLLAFLSKRLDLPELMALARQQPEENLYRPNREILPWALRAIFWPVEDEDAAFVPNKHDFYPEMQWMVARYNPDDPNALVLAAKGGHNREMHNQNDVGSFIVHMNGESVIADIGRGRYTRAYFREQRYEHFVCQSLGHSCPVPNGQQQGAGLEFAATLVDHQADDAHDKLSIDMAGAYPEAADLDKLIRTFTLHRDGENGWVEVVDDVTFVSEAGTLESVLTTFGSAKVELDTVVIIGEKGKVNVGYDIDKVSVTIEKKENVDLAEGETDVNLVKFSLKNPAKSGTIQLMIYPQ